MLIVSGRSRQENRRRLAAELRGSKIISRVVIDRSRPIVESVTWQEYWQPCRAFFEAVTRLVHRLNRLRLATTSSGRSSIAQIMKVASAIIVEDIDLMPEHLSTHREQFGLAGTAAIHSTSDGFATESQQYVITKPKWADALRGVRLW